MLIVRQWPVVDVPQRKTLVRLAGERLRWGVPRPVAVGPHETKLLDNRSDRPGSGRPFRGLTMCDSCTRESLAITEDSLLPTRRRFTPRRQSHGPRLTAS